MKEEELVNKYRKRLEEEFKENNKIASNPNSYSANYVDFKKEFLPKHLSFYEKLCNSSEKMLKISPDKKTSESLNDQIELCHLNVTPSGVYSFGVLSFLIIVVAISLIGFAVFKSFFFIIYAVLVGAVTLAALVKLPEFFGNSWRLKASNQMVQAIFYVSTYLRHTSNLELAIMFASDHLSPPISIDLKKVLWDVETEKYGSIKESLDNYLERWKKWNPEFIEAFHLIEGSLFESSEDRRLSMVDKALNVMLEETYEKMLRYAHELKGPITMLYMLGIILPILGLVILPLIASFMTNSNGGLDSGQLTLYLVLLYDITMPLGVYYLSKIVLSKRPTGYGETDISEDNPELKKYRNFIFKFGKSETAINPIYISIIIAFVLLLVGVSPLLAKAVVPKEILVSNTTDIMDAKKIIFDYRLSNPSDPQSDLIGPFGLGAAIISFLIPLAIGLSIGIYFSIKSSKVIQFRENTKKLENEYASALFQLGNRLGDGIPAEIAFGKVAETTKGSASGDFFALVSINIRKKGMGLKQAIFDPVKGALIYFPSSIIESSMKVLIESSKKGPIIASQALVNVSEYIKQINRVNERLKDLMADVISDMKQQTHILAPAIAAIVVGITSMIVSILGSLSASISSISSGNNDIPSGSINGVLDIFGQGIPTYYFQIIVGIYVVEIVYILTVLTNGIENGADHLSEEYNLGKNMLRSTIIYTVIAVIVVISFNLIATMIMDGLKVG